MSTHKHIDKICVVIILIALFVTVLFMNGERFGLAVSVDEDSEAYSDSQYFTTRDQDGSTDVKGAYEIVLKGTDAKISGNGAYINDGNIVIGQAGTYVISGSLTDGSIVVDAFDAAHVRIILNGVDVYCSDDAALRVEQADKVFLTLAEGSENHFSSGSEYAKDALDDGTNGTIFAHDDLTINGSGSLVVKAEYRHGIAANDDLVIAGGTITVDAPADAINANDSVRIKDAALTLTAEDDGVAVTHKEGYFYMESGKLSVTSKDDAIHAAGDVTIAGGEVAIHAGDDGIHSDTAVAISDGTIRIDECYEGIEALTIDVSGGDIEIYPQDDGFNANGGSSDMFGGPPPNMQQGNQEGTQQAGQQGNQEGTQQTGETGASQSEQKAGQQTAQTGERTGSEGQTAANGQSQSASSNTAQSVQGEDVKAGQFANGNQGNRNEKGAQVQSENTNGNQSQTEGSNDDAEEEETYIRISGGRIVIINKDAMDADGLDSNGDIEITGGTIFVSLKGDGINNAVDYGSESGGKATISGGTLIACGGSGMVESFDSSSKQCVILYNLSEKTEDNTMLRLTDEKGKDLLSYEVPCGFTSANISCPELEVGQTYQLMIGDDTEEIKIEETAGSYGEEQSQMMGPGGGFRPFGGQNNGEGSDSTDGSKPEFFGNGNFPAPPTNGDGTFPAFQGNGNGNFPMPPGSDGGQTTDSDGDSADKGNAAVTSTGQQAFPMQPPDQQEKEDESEETEETTDTRLDIRELGREEKLLLGASGIALLFGLIFVGAFRRRWKKGL